MSLSRLCWINGKLTNNNDGAVPLLDHGVLYGDGVFEGLRYYDRRVFRLREHLARLAQSARALELALPYDDATFGAALDEVIAATGIADGYLRLVVTRGVGDLGLDPRSCGQANAFILTGAVRTVGEAARRGAAVIMATTRQSSPDQLDPRIKSLNYLPRILARLEANRAGADEAIMLNPAGFIAEGTADNLFVVRSGVLLTPPVTDGALEGVTRAAVLELAQAAGIPSEIRSLGPLDLRTADEAFLTGTATELVPITTVEGRPLPACPGPMFTQIDRAFQELVRRPASR